MGLVGGAPGAVRLTASGAICLFFTTINIDVSLIFTAVLAGSGPIGAQWGYLILAAITFPIDRLIGRRIFEHLPITSLIAEIDRAAKCPAENGTDDGTTKRGTATAIMRADQTTGDTTQHRADHIATTSDRTVVG